MSTVIAPGARQDADSAIERLPNGMRIAKMPNLDWFIEHFEELVSIYPDQWLAISKQSVLASATTPEALTKILHAEHRGIPALIVRCSVGGWVPYK